MLRRYPTGPCSRSSSAVRWATKPCPRPMTQSAGSRVRRLSRPPAPRSAGSRVRWVSRPPALASAGSPVRWVPRPLGPASAGSRVRRLPGPLGPASAGSRVRRAPGQPAPVRRLLAGRFPHMPPHTPRPRSSPCARPVSARMSGSPRAEPFPARIRGSLPVPRPAPARASAGPYVLTRSLCALAGSYVPRAGPYAPLRQSPRAKRVPTRLTRPPRASTDLDVPHPVRPAQGTWEPAPQPVRAASSASRPATCVRSCSAISSSRPSGSSGAIFSMAPMALSSRSRATTLSSSLRCASHSSRT
jgi:hypothetical protein